MQQNHQLIMTTIIIVKTVVNDMVADV